MNTGITGNTNEIASATIGVFLGAFGDYQDAIFSGIKQIADQHQLNTICFNGAALDDPQSYRRHWNTIYDLANASSIDGLIVLSAAIGNFITTEELTQFCARFAPLPTISVGEKLRGMSSTTFNNAAGLHDVINHLIHHHHRRRIAFIRGPEDHPHAQDRYHTYHEALKHYGIPFDPELVAPGDFRIANGSAAVKLLMDQRKVSFDAIVASNDAMAFGAWEGLNERGVSVPEEVALVGFDDLPAAKSFAIPLTTIRQPLAEQGRAAARMLVEYFQQGTLPENVEVGTELVIRESCGCLSYPTTGSPTSPTSSPIVLVSEAKKDLSEQRETLLRDIEGILCPQFANIDIQLIEPMLDAFFAMLQGESPVQFLSNFKRLLQTSAANLGHVQLEDGIMGAWHETVSLLRQVMLLNGRSEAVQSVEDVLHHARTLITDVVERTHSNLRRLAANHARIQGEIVCELNIASDIEQIANVLAENMPLLGIRTCALTLYQGEAVPPPLSRLIMIYHDGERVQLEGDGRLFPTTQLIPPDIVPRDRWPRLTLHPLAARDIHFGYIITEMIEGYRSMEITYVTLCEQIGAALHRTMLMQQIKQANEHLQKARDTLEERVTERTFELLTANTGLQKEIIKREKTELTLRESETMLQSVLDAISVRVFWKDTDYRMIGCNQLFADDIGVESPNDLIGKSDQDSSNPVQLAQFAQYRDDDRRVIETGIPKLKYEEQLMRPDGSILWLRTSKIPLRDNAGNIIGVLGTYQDITEQKEFQEKLTALHEVSFELAAIHSVEQMCLKAIELGRSRLGYDRLGLMVHTNADKTRMSKFGIDAAGRLLAETDVLYTAEEKQAYSWLTNRESILVVNAADLHDFEVAHSVGQGWNVMSGIWDRDINIGWVAADNLYENKPLIPYQIELLRLYGLTLGHLLAQKSAKAEIRKLNEDLEQRIAARTQQLESANRELEAFSYSVSHDLRAPLRAIDGFSRTLSRNYQADLPDKAQHYLSRIQYNAKHMGNLIDDLLALSRIGRKALRIEAVNMNALVQEILSELSIDTELEHLEITVASLPDCMADRALLKQVLFNLITNAIKYSSKRETPQIKILHMIEDNETVYLIRDNGVGFDMQYIGNLFGVFQRLHSAEEYEGTGIGLATARRIVDRHGGRIWAESSVNQGATFYFTLRGEDHE